MKYTAAERKTIRKVLQTARQHLWDGVGKPGWKEKYLCLAVLITMDYDSITPPQAHMVTAMIHNRLQGHLTVSTWLQAQLGYDPSVRHNAAVVQAYRKRWLESMIEEFA